MTLSLHDIVKYLSKIFERKKDNAVSLPNDAALSSDLKRIIIGDEDTPVEISKTELKVKGTINAEAINVNGLSVSTEPDEDSAVITALNNATAGELVTVGSTITELDCQAGLTYSAVTGSLTITSDEALHSQLKLTHAGTDFFLIDAKANGATKISTFDAVGSDADLEIESDGKLLLDVNSTAADAFTLDCEGEINLDTALGDIYFFKGGTKYGQIEMDSGTIFELAAAEDFGLQLTTINTSIILDSSNAITLDAGNGYFIAKNAGTEFSAANSAYAGMILGYTQVGADAADDSYALTTSYLVFETDLAVTFKTPPSELVEIQATFYYTQGSGGRNVFAAISNNTTYTSSDLHHYVQHEKAVTNEALRGGNGIVTVSWYLISNSLAAIGSSNTIYFAAKCDSTSGTPTIKWGGNATDEYQNFVMRAIALPA